MGLKKTDLAYAAGIIDGEGCISCNWSKKKYPYLVVQVNNTNEWLLQWFSFCFGGSKVSLMKDRRERSKSWKPLYHWHTNSTDALEFLQLIYPYLRLKKAQADIAISCLKMRQYKGRHLTDTERVIVEAEMVAMQKLNKRGI